MVHLLTRRIQRLADGHLLALRHVGVGRSEHLLQELVHRLSGFTLAGLGGLGLQGVSFGLQRVVALDPGTEKAVGRPAQSEQQRQRDQCRSGHARLVLAGELAPAVDGARRTRQHRLVVQMPLHVRCQAVGGVVAARAVLLHRLERNPVQVSSDLPMQRAGVGAMSLGHVDGRDVERREPRARAWRLRLADHPRHLIHARPAQCLGVEWRRARQ